MISHTSAISCLHRLRPGLVPGLGADAPLGSLGHHGSSPRRPGLLQRRHTAGVQTGHGQLAEPLLERRAGRAGDPVDPAGRLQALAAGGCSHGASARDLACHRSIWVEKTGYRLPRSARSIGTRTSSMSLTRSSASIASRLGVELAHQGVTGVSAVARSGLKAVRC